MKSNTYELHNYAAILTTPTTKAKTKKTPQSREVARSNTMANKTKKDKSADAAAPASKVNNRRNEKYSLRQRQKRRSVRSQFEEEITRTAAAGAMSGSDVDHMLTDGFTSEHDLDVGINTTGTSGQKAASKAKTKAAPLSKYRRKTANARERTRMREINCAFENLRHCVPQAITGDEAVNTNEKLTKITTLRLAMKYIGLLSEALTNPSFETDFLLECLRDSSERQRNDAEAAATAMAMATTLTSVNNEVYSRPPASASAAATTTNKTNSKSKAKTSKTKASAKRNASATGNSSSLAKKQKLQQQLQQQHQQLQLQQQQVKHPATITISSPESAYSSPGSSLHSICSSAAASPSSAYASLSAHSTPDLISSIFSTSSSQSSSATSPLYNNNLLDVVVSPSEAAAALEFNTLLLESDGESLHLSEHCLSPIQSHHYDQLQLNAELLAPPPLPLPPPASSSASASSSLPISRSSSDLPIACSMDQPDMELSLRLLDSTDPHSFDFAMEPQQPSDCISPLATLDSFNPFADLLPSDFAEHNTLDLFLT